MAEDFGEYRRLIEDFMSETRRMQGETQEALRKLSGEVIQLRTQLIAARWVATPLIAAVTAGAVALLFKRLGG